MMFFRRKVNFYRLLSEQAHKVEEGMNALLIFMREPTILNGRTVQRLEEEADEIRANIAEELNNAFVTPIDREDIHALSRSVDDIIDYGKTTVEEMMAFGVKPNGHLLLMAEALCEAADTVTEMTDVKHAFRAGVQAQKGIDL